MRHFKDGDTLMIEPWRAQAFPVIKDLVVDRSAFDRIIQAGGYISVNTGSAPEANAMPVVLRQRRTRHGCRRLHRLRGLRRGLPERFGHALRQRQGVPAGAPAAGSAGAQPAAPSPWCGRWTPEGFGNCSNHRECEQTCPKEISIVNIARLNREFIKASLGSQER